MLSEVSAESMSTEWKRCVALDMVLDHWGSQTVTRLPCVRLWKMSLPRGLSTQRRKLDSFPRHCRHAITRQNIDRLRQTNKFRGIFFGYKCKKTEISYFLFTFRMWLFSVFTKCHTLLSTSQFKISITALLRFSKKAHLEEMITSPLCDFYPNDGDALANC